MHSLNQHLQSENRFQWTEEVEEATEYIDWRRVYLDDGSCIWTKDKKVLLSPEELKQIEKIPKEKLVNERYYVKRIWLNRYINNHLYDKTTSNTTLVVSRENIFEESYNQFMTTDGLDLKRAMHIFFIDEVAHDVGGVYREWYACLFESIFSTEFNFFTLVTESNLVRGTYYISETEPKVYKDLSHYEFIGKILAKAIFDKITIKANFNKILIKHLLKLPVELEDLKFYDTGLYFSLKSLLEDSLKENGEFTFTWNIRVNGELKEIELIPNGASIYLNDDNKSLFIKEV